MNDNLPTTSNLSDPKVIETIRKTVAVGADDIELAMFLEFCKSAGLNPFKREAWFIKAGNRPQIMTGLAGYLKIANKHSQFDGMKVEIVENDKGEIVKAITEVYRKDRKYPSVGIALMKEYRKDTPIWKQMPSVMLGKVSKCIAIREAFPLETEGTYAEEEMPPSYAADAKPLPANVKPADQLQAEALAGDEGIMYDINELDEEHKPAAEALLSKAGAREVGPDCWVSPKKIGKLKNYEIGMGEGTNENHQSA